MTPITHHYVNHRLPAPGGPVTEDRSREGDSARATGRPAGPEPATSAPGKRGN